MDTKTRSGINLVLSIGAIGLIGASFFMNRDNKVKTDNMFGLGLLLWGLSYIGNSAATDAPLL